MPPRPAPPGTRSIPPQTLPPTQPQKHTPTASQRRPPLTAKSPMASTPRPLPMPVALMELVAMAVAACSAIRRAAAMVVMAKAATR